MEGGTLPVKEFTLYGVLVTALGVVGLCVRQVVIWVKNSNDAEAQLRAMLITRVQRLEDRLDRSVRLHEAEKRYLTHKLRNVTMSFESMLMMLKMNPDRVPEIVEAIEKQRSEHRQAEAKEAAGIYREELEDPQEGE